MDNAIRQNIDKLNKYSKYLKDLKLVDYKVRILNTGTEAVTRVSIESTDSKGKIGLLLVFQQILLMHHLKH